MADRSSLMTLRSSAVLTGSYVASSVIGADLLEPGEVAICDELALFLAFTIGSLTSCEIKVEFSDDGINWRQETIEAPGAPSGGIIISSTYLNVHQLTGTGNFKLIIPYACSYLRVSAQGTGTATNSLLGITAVVRKS